MNNPATKARESSLHCEAKKHAYRQTQDGVVVSFVLHPQEVPDGLATASLGTRYMLAMVEIGDNEEPKPQQPVAKTDGKRAFGDLPRSQQAALALQRESFRRFLEEDGAPCGDATLADLALKSQLGILSKTEMDIADSLPAREWDRIYRQFNDWLNEPQP
jgi:hypothetical protein